MSQKQTLSELAPRHRGKTAGIDMVRRNYATVTYMRTTWACRR